MPSRVNSRQVFVSSSLAQRGFIMKGSRIRPVFLRGKQRNESCLPKAKDTIIVSGTLLSATRQSKPNDHLSPVSA